MRGRGAFVHAAAVFMVSALLAGHAPPAVAAQSVADGLWWHQQWRMEEVWAISDGSGVTVAVVDSGVDASVPELAGAVLPGNDFVRLTDGRRDHGGSDGFGHGTAMAVLIAGNGQGSGVRGVAPGASILPVAVLGSSDTDHHLPLSYLLVDAITWAVDNGADVINMSLGESGPCPPPLEEAVRYAISHDVVLVAASGNDNRRVVGHPGNCPGVLTVGANDAMLEPWENTYRSEFVDVSAPGVYISAVGIGGQPGFSNGTSNAAALVSGAIALLRSHYPHESADQILARVFATVRDLPPEGWDDATGYGIVRPYHALTEPVPPGAPNPVFDALEPWPTPSAPAPPPPMLADPPPPAAAEDSGRPALPLLVLLGGALVVLAGGGALLWMLLARRSPPPTGS